MADSEILLQPTIQAELNQYRVLEHHLQVSRQQCQEFKELAKQVIPGNTQPLPAPLSDGSPAVELDAAFSALKQQIRAIHQIETQLNEQQRASRSPVQKSQQSQPLQSQSSVMRENIKIALYVMGGIVLFFLSLIVLHAINH